MTPKEELEALDGLAQFIIMNDNGTDESASAIEWHGILKKALTPPTADELCKVLSEYFGFSFYYQDNFFYRSDGIKYIYPLKVSGFTEIQLYDGHLPPHLITLIGQFYEGEIK